MHEPSFGSTACVVTVPETAAPVSVSDQVTVVAPCESTPVPFHVPAKPIGCDEGEVGVAGEPAHEIASTMMAMTETTRRANFTTILLTSGHASRDYSRAKTNHQIVTTA